MFIDEVCLVLKAGKGGDGIVSWRREKYIPKGGPYGGNGGNGGDIILRATTHENTLSKFRHLKKIQAKNGERGGTQVMQGMSAPPSIIEVPIGTIVTDIETGEILHDFSRPSEELLLCQGGRGGYGNAHFPSSTRQAPNFAELGDKGEEREVRFELKLVADIGLVGLPNAGKSTLISALTRVRPKIANYPFTTLVPNLGVLEWKGQSLIIEDVPGLIAGASEGKGLGFQFLKHIDRCKALIHLVDVSEPIEAMIQNYILIEQELTAWYQQKEKDTPQEKQEKFIVFSKMDLIDTKECEKKKKAFEKKTGMKVSLCISAGGYLHIDELKDVLITQKKYWKTQENEAPMQKYERKVYNLTLQKDPKKYTLSRGKDGNFYITGERIEEIVRMTDMRYQEGIQRIYDVLNKVGIIRKIKSILTQELSDGASLGFFEGEEDFVTPSVIISEQKFPLEGLIFMRVSDTPLKK